MKKKLYYTVEHQLEDIDGIGETNGHKDVTTYSVVDGEIEKQFDLELVIEDNTEEEIDEYLIDNGMDEYELIKL